LEHSLPARRSENLPGLGQSCRQRRERAKATIKQRMVSWTFLDSLRFEDSFPVGEDLGPFFGDQDRMLEMGRGRSIPRDHCPIIAQGLHFFASQVDHWRKCQYLPSF